jgi:hypothetical protein
MYLDHTGGKNKQYLFMFIGICKPRYVNRDDFLSFNSLVLSIIIRYTNITLWRLDEMLCIIPG